MTASVPIWLDELAAGQVAVAADGSLSLRYADRWLQTAGAFPLSVPMPLRAEPSPSDGIAPWLANLLPEEDQLRVLTRSLGLDQADVLAVLAEIGGDTAGALSFGAATVRALWPYAPLTAFYATADPRLALERHFEDLGRRPFLVDDEGVRQSLAGGQTTSALAVLGPGGAPVLRLPQEGDVLAIPLNGAPSTLIVKPDNPSLPGITENEVWCLCMAPGRKYERGTPPGLDLRTPPDTARHVSANDALALLAPLYDVPRVLSWPHVVQTAKAVGKNARRMAGRL